MSNNWNVFVKSDLKNTAIQFKGKRKKKKKNNIGEQSSFWGHHAKTYSARRVTGSTHEQKKRLCEPVMWMIVLSLCAFMNEVKSAPKSETPNPNKD